MRTYIILFIGLLAFSGYGQRNFSRTSLEGWGKNGVLIAVEDYSKDVKTFDAKAIERQVEVKLLLAGIKVVKEIKGDGIIINAQPVKLGGRLVGYSLSVQPKRVMTFKHIGIEYMTLATSEEYGGTVDINGLRKDIDKYMDQLLLNYKKVNVNKNENIAGFYVFKLGDLNFSIVLQDNGIAEIFQKGKKLLTGRWKTVRNELWIDEAIYSINRDGSLTYIASMEGGKRTAQPKNNRLTFKKIN